MSAQSNLEILAPAGTPDALLAAVRCGADAVYLGGKALNARRNAGNFDDEALARAVSYCHARGVKVHLTLNTLANDAELREAAQMIERGCALGVDALIVQDLGVAALARRMAPDMMLHASTQMSVHTAAGLRALAALGFTRAVLARELSGAEIAALAQDSPLELEVFVHGALCMSVSGQCYFSAMLGSRSGNRGLCAQPCRLPFAAPGGTGHDLSLKDLSLISQLPRLGKSGVCSVKIEGRMKRPEYVAAAVTACRQALAGGVDPSLSAQLQAVFSRSGFTQGYYEGKRGREMFGTRGHSDVVAAEPVLRKLSQLYDRETPRVPVSFSMTALPGRPVSLTAKSGPLESPTQIGPIPEPARSRPANREALARQLEKCGGTPFYTDAIAIELGENLSVPLSAVNALRRGALEQLESMLGAPVPVPCSPAAAPPALPHRAQATAVFARFDSASQLPADLSGVRAVILPLETNPEVWQRLTQRGILPITELPRGMFGREFSVVKALDAVRGAGVSDVFAGTLDTLFLAKEQGFVPHGGFGLNCFNTRAIETLAQLGCADLLLSPELTLRQAAEIGGSVPRGIFAYGRLPLMLTRNCPLSNGLSCKECGSLGALTDRKGVSFPVRCAGGCSEVLNSRPVYLGDKQNQLAGFDFQLLYFTVESQGECAGVLRDFREQRPAQGEFTRGLAFRGVE